MRPSLSDFKVVKKFSERHRRPNKENNDKHKAGTSEAEHIPKSFVMMTYFALARKVGLVMAAGASFRKESVPRRASEWTEYGNPFWNPLN